jgi:hypothetical protein
LRWPRADWSHLRVTEEDWCSAVQSRLPLRKQSNRRSEWFLTTWLSSLRFYVLFSSCKENARI